MVKKIFACVLLVILSFSVTAFAMAKSVDYLRDGAEILDSEASLETRLDEASLELGVYVVVATTDISYGGAVDEAGRKYCYEAGLNHISDDVILLVINMEDRMYDIFLWGEPYFNISTSQVNSILDDMESQMREGDYDGAIRVFINNILDLQVLQDEEEGLVYIGSYALVGLIVMVVTFGVFVGVVTLKYKMKLTPTNYPLEEFTRLDLKDRDDIFLSRNVTKTVVQSSGSSRGGSRGGHAGGRGF